MNTRDKSELTTENLFKEDTKLDTTHKNKRVDRRFVDFVDFIERQRGFKFYGGENILSLLAEKISVDEEQNSTESLRL